MPAKVDTYLALARETALGMAGSVGAWTAFLDTASRLYKYPFHDQLMIHAQRPEATACASYEVWNDTMRRYVRRGAKGIALVDNSGDAPRLRYVFDIADTGTRRSSRPFAPWEIKTGTSPKSSSACGRRSTLMEIGSQASCKTWRATSPRCISMHIGKT